MIDRICISINNRCNLACSYCHFHEKGEIEAAEMDVYEILDHAKEYVGQGFKMDHVKEYAWSGFKMDHAKEYAGQGFKMDYVKKYAGQGFKMDHVKEYAGSGFKMDHVKEYAGQGFKMDHVKEYAAQGFKIGFVGNGECFLDWQALKSYIAYLENAPGISLYTITNGTVRLPEEDLAFLEERRVNVGFSVDGYRELHNRYRCGSFDRVMENVAYYRQVTGHYPTFNATVGRESLENAERVISFFRPFGTKVTFSRMIGKYGISLEEYRAFLDRAGKEIPVRLGGTDCTMYGGLCGAGTNNYFFANGKTYYCGNCIDLPPVGDSGMSFWELEKISLTFERSLCYKELLS